MSAFITGNVPDHSNLSIPLYNCWSNDTRLSMACCGIAAGYYNESTKYCKEAPPNTASAQVFQYLSLEYRTCIETVMLFNSTYSSAMYACNQSVVSDTCTGAAALSITRVGYSGLVVILLLLASILCVIP
ncbi:hypothetical protein BD324DRAFT_683673 [Kockovaella imperatae]|uniref:Uncharacterized protein n=1 Tax=Kockovaella imperatae TaxID=4999 RepID=A0A1Y1U9R1_9TREE|nr:hypothetical protein BD324DRAFT_683673 [Kockovaella imperatae]ORX34246.1 hypothetical protein BD324DRAFT_683673 [Kockovaella imperatae]